MKRRSFLALLGIAPAAAIVPPVAVSVAISDAGRDSIVHDFVADASSRIVDGVIRGDMICTNSIKASKIVITDMSLQHVLDVPYRQAASFDVIVDAAIRQQA